MRLARIQRLHNAAVHSRHALTGSWKEARDDSRSGSDIMRTTYVNVNPIAINSHANGIFTFEICFFCTAIDETLAVSATFLSRRERKIVNFRDVLFWWLEGVTAIATGFDNCV